MTDGLARATTVKGRFGVRAIYISPLASLSYFPFSTESLFVCFIHIHSFIHLFFVHSCSCSFLCFYGLRHGVFAVCINQSISTLKSSSVFLFYNIIIKVVSKSLQTNNNEQQSSFSFNNNNDNNNKYRRQNRIVATFCHKCTSTIPGCGRYGRRSGH